MGTYLTLCTFIYLQGSQTRSCLRMLLYKLCTFIYLQGSQTKVWECFFYICFAPLFTYKVLKPTTSSVHALCCFAPLFTYKVLKQLILSISRPCSFAPLFTYKVLKPVLDAFVLHSCFAPLFTYKVLKPQIFFQGHHRTHNILAYVQAFSLYQRKTFSKLVMLICNNAIVIVKNIQFFTISFVIYTEFYQH